MLTGSCSCGKVKYSVEDAFLYFFYCHCAECRTSTGSAFNAAAGIDESKFKLTEGKENLTHYPKPKEYADGLVSTVSFCKTCGSSVFSTKTWPKDPTKKPIKQVRMGTLIDRTEARPQGHVWVLENAPWFSIKEEAALPQFPTVASSPPTPGPVYPSRPIDNQEGN
jgi:hypothetical protein